MIAALSGVLGCAGGAVQTARAPRDLSPVALYPLHEGSAWSYDVDAGDGQSVLATSRVLRVTEGVVEVQSGQGIQRYLLEPQGIKRVGGDAYLLRAPIAVGSSWQAGPSTRASVTAVDKAMKTPAGEFEACVVVAEQNSDSGQEIETTYCPGVGPVRVESRMQVRGQRLKVTAVLRGFSLEAGE
jgi:hypothetical protein